VLAAVVIGVVLGQRRGRAEWLVRRGESHLRRYERREAQADFREAHALSANAHTATRSCESEAWFARLPDELVRAEVLCREAATLAPNEALPLAMRALVRLRQERLDAALTDAEAATSKDPALAMAVSVAVHVHWARRELDAGAKACATLLDGSDDRYNDASDVGACLDIWNGRGDLKAARKYAERWVRLKPDNPDAALALAWVDRCEDRLAESRTEYERALREYDAEPSIWVALAWVELDAGHLAAARTAADRAVALDPNSASNLAARCFALEGLGELAAARVDCMKAVTLDPADSTSAGMLALLDGRYADARQSWQRASTSPINARELGPWLAKLPAP
jgi:tetratricopeptide (TPR) repeat protein